MTPAPPTTPETQKPQALAAVSDRLFFQHLLDHGPDTRTNIAAAAGLSRPTASEAAQRLSLAGIVRTTQRPSQQTAARRGRTPDFYDIDPGYGHCLVLAAASGRAIVRTQDLRGTVLHETGIDLPEDLTPGDLENTLRALIAEAVASTGTRCLAATASLGNPVDPHSQRPIALPDAPFPAGVGDLLSVLREQCDGPIRLDNDINWALLAEHQAGSARGVDDVVLCYLGPGVGAGLLMSGEVQRGRHGTAGELGYLRYGGRTLMSLLLEHGAAAPGGDRLDIDACRKIFAQDPDSARAHRFVEALADALGNITTFLDVHTLVIGGPLATSRPFMNLLRRALEPHALLGGAVVVESELRERAPLEGAALAAQEMARAQIWAGYRC